MSVTIVCGSAISFHHFAQKLQHCLAIAAPGNIGFEDFALLIDGAPKIVDLAVDADENLVQMPTPLWPRTQMPCSLERERKANIQLHRKTNP